MSTSAPVSSPAHSPAQVPALFVSHGAPLFAVDAGETGPALTRWGQGLRAQFPALRGVVVIKAQQYRSQEQNRADALDRLNALVQSVAEPPRTRRATKPTYGSRQRRLQAKTQRGETKALRGKVRD